MPVVVPMLAAFVASGSPGCVKLPVSASGAVERRNVRVSPSGSVAGTRNVQRAFSGQMTMGGSADTAELERKLAAAPDDHAARLELSKAYAAAGLYREALEAALEVVRRDRFFGEGAGRKAILQIFEALGADERFDDLVREFRRALSAALN